MTQTLAFDVDDYLQFEEDEPSNEDYAYLLLLATDVMRQIQHNGNRRALIQNSSEKIALHKGKTYRIQRHPGFTENTPHQFLEIVDNRDPVVIGVWQGAVSGSNHMELSISQNGSAVAKDLGSRNGTTVFCQDRTAPLIETRNLRKVKLSRDQSVFMDSYYSFMLGSVLVMFITADDLDREMNPPIQTQGQNQQSTSDDMGDEPTQRYDLFERDERPDAATAAGRPGDEPTQAYDDISSIMVDDDDSTQRYGLLDHIPPETPRQPIQGNGARSSAEAAPSPFGPLSSTTTPFNLRLDTSIVNSATPKARTHDGARSSQDLDTSGNYDAAAVCTHDDGAAAAGSTSAGIEATVPMGLGGDADSGSASGSQNFGERAKDDIEPTMAFNDFDVDDDATQAVDSGLFRIQRPEQTRAMSYKEEETDFAADESPTAPISSIDFAAERTSQEEQAAPAHAAAPSVVVSSVAEAKSQEQQEDHMDESEDGGGALNSSQDMSAFSSPHPDALAQTSQQSNDGTAEDPSTPTDLTNPPTFDLRQEKEQEVSQQLSQQHQERKQQQAQQGSSEVTSDVGKEEDQEEEEFDHATQTNHGRRLSGLREITESVDSVPAEEEQRVQQIPETEDAYGTRQSQESVDVRAPTRADIVSNIEKERAEPVSESVLQEQASPAAPAEVASEPVAVPSSSAEEEEAKVDVLAEDSDTDIEEDEDVVMATPPKQDVAPVAGPEPVQQAVPIESPHQEELEEEKPVIIDASPSEEQPREQSMQQPISQISSAHQFAQVSEKPLSEFGNSLPSPAVRQQQQAEEFDDVEATQVLADDDELMVDVFEGEDRSSIQETPDSLRSRHEGEKQSSENVDGVTQPVQHEDQPKDEVSSGPEKLSGEQTQEAAVPAPPKQEEEAQPERTEPVHEAPKEQLPQYLLGFLESQPANAADVQMADAIQAPAAPKSQTQADDIIVISDHSNVEADGDVDMTHAEHKESSEKTQIIQAAEDTMQDGEEEAEEASTSKSRRGRKATGRGRGRGGKTKTESQSASQPTQGTRKRNRISLTKSEEASGSAAASGETASSQLSEADAARQSAAPTAAAASASSQADITQVEGKQADVTDERPAKRSRKASTSTAPAAAAAKPNSPKAASEKVKLMFTQFKPDDAMEEKIKKLQGEILQDLADYTRCTHLVTQHCKRTPKLLACLNAGAYIVNPSWIKDSTNHKWADASKHLLQDSAGERQHNVRLAQTWVNRQSLLNEGKKIFTGMKFFVTPSVLPPVAEMQLVIEAGEGVVVAMPSDIDDSTLIVSTKNDLDVCNKLIKDGTTTADHIYSTDIILAGSIKQDLSEKDSWLLPLDTPAEEKAAKGRGRKTSAKGK